MSIPCWGGVVQQDACLSCDAGQNLLSSAAQVYPVGVQFWSHLGVGGLVGGDLHLGDVSVSVAGRLSE